MSRIKLTLVLIVSLMVLGSVISGCSTVHGVGEDLDTLGRGISNHHQTPKVIQQESSQK